MQAQPAGAGRILSGTGFHSRWMEVVLPGCDPAEVADNCVGLVVSRLRDCPEKKSARSARSCGSWHHFPRSIWRWRSSRVSTSETATCCPCIPSPFCSRRRCGSGRDSKPAAVALLMLLAALNAADALRFAPGYLSYFTPFVRPDGKLPPADRQQPRLGTGTAGFTRLSTQPSRRADLRCRTLAASIRRFYGIQSNELGSQHVSGTIVVSATNLSGQFLAEPEQISLAAATEAGNDPRPLTLCF